MHGTAVGRQSGGVGAEGTNVYSRGPSSPRGWGAGMWMAPTAAVPRVQSVSKVKSLELTLTFKRDSHSVHSLIPAVRERVVCFRCSPLPGVAQAWHKCMGQYYLRQSLWFEWTCLSFRRRSANVAADLGEAHLHYKEPYKQAPPTPPQTPSWIRAYI